MKNNITCNQETEINRSEEEGKSSRVESETGKEHKETKMKRMKVRWMEKKNIIKHHKRSKEKQKLYKGK